jgi:hypothetical protein
MTTRENVFKTKDNKNRVRAVAE